MTRAHFFRRCRRIGFNFDKGAAEGRAALPKNDERVFILLALAVLLILAPVAAHAQQGRPPITGISHMCVYTSDAAGADHFYGTVLKAQKGPDPEDPSGVRYYFSSTQFVEVRPLPAQHTISRMAHVAYNTTDVAAMRAYLMAHPAATSATPVVGSTGSTSGAGAMAVTPAQPTAIQHGSDGSQWFETKDPEGNVVQFVQPGPTAITVSSGPISSRVIHVGFLVHSKADEDRFYHGVLGFRPYWYGAMQPGKVDWISQEVPNGHDWLEYMMVGAGSDTATEHVDQRQLGVLNHFSLGVQNMEAAVTTLIKYDRLSPRHDGPQMGKDGKWQANLYDPDGTRVELMEFQPVTAPCCSGFTAESPVD